MTHHLSSDHFIEVEHEGLRWTVVVSEYDGRFTTGKISCADRNQWKDLTQPMRTKCKQTVSDIAIRFCKDKYIHSIIRSGI